MNEITAVFIDRFRVERGSNETSHLRDAISYTLAQMPQGGWVSSYEVANELVRQRRESGTVDAKQTLEYVQHLFREADHVCRYADEGHYNLHADPQCSAFCDSHRKRTTTVKNEARPMCPHCFLMLPCTGVCDCQS